MRNPFIKFFILFIGLFFSLFNYAIAQNTTVSGIIRDAKTKEIIPYVSVFFEGTQTGTLANQRGAYQLITNQKYTKIKFTFIGYKDVIRPIKSGVNQTVDVYLEQAAALLQEVSVTAKKHESYKNKDNPAVELIRKVIENKSSNRIEAAQTVFYKQDEKMTFSMSNLSDQFKDKKIFKDYQFMFQTQDSTKIGGKNILPIYLEEKLSDHYLRKSPNQSKTIVLAQRQVDFNSKYLDNNGLQAYFDRMYQAVDIYENNINVMSNQFLSPIANSSPTFYKYFITDTLKNQNPPLVELSFSPRNPNDLLFEGKIYITLDGKYAVKEASLSLNKHANIDFVRELNIYLSFDKDSTAHYFLAKSNLIADFGITKNKGTGFTGQRTVAYQNYKVNIPLADSLFNGPASVVLADANKKNESYWTANRLDTLSKDQAKIYHNIDTLQTIPSFKKTMELATILLIGYKTYKNYEIGPMQTFNSFNNVEGYRLRFGGRSTANLSSTYFFENYIAYGFKDQKLKYFLSGTYSLNHQSIYKFPQNYIKVSFLRDTKIPGQELQFNQENSFLLSFKRGVNDMLLYNDIYRIDYTNEFENHFSYTFGFKKWTQSPAGGLVYTQITDNRSRTISKLTTSELSLQLRYAPKEKFYQGKTTRVSFIAQYPIFNFRYAAGIKGLLGGEYNYQNFLGTVDKRFQLSQLGFADVTLEGGYIAGKAPFPLLTVHRANQSYANLFNSYNLMNFLEFVSDHYASINVDQNFNGFFLNKIPLLKALKLREIVSFKALYGGVRNENNPAFNTNLYQLPLYENGNQRTYTLGKVPYLEGGVGIGNIFKVLRFDLIKRFNYLNQPEVSSWGIRASISTDF